jgi:hypothetical protein
VTSQPETSKSTNSPKTRKVKPKPRQNDRYSFVLLTIMLIVALVSSIVAFVFGQRALTGVSPVPADGRLPRMNLSDKKQKPVLPKSPVTPKPIP